MRVGGSVGDGVWVNVGDGVIVKVGVDVEVDVNVDVWVDVGVGEANIDDEPQADKINPRATK